MMAFIGSTSDVGGTAADPASSDRFDIRAADDQNKTLGMKERECRTGFWTHMFKKQ